jgi:predicted TIM-barrel fold metal-dependent hydrolase
MFGTDYPVSKIHMNFNQIYEIFKTIASVLTPEEQAKLFHHNAKRYYRL